MKNLAIFDLDHTLINTDSDNAWPQFMMEKGFLDKEVAAAQNAKFYQDYQNGCLNVHEFVAFQIEPMKALSQETLHELHREFTEKYIKPHITAMAKMLVESHRDAGDELLVISSTNEFIISPICHLFGINNIIGTQLEQNAQGRYTGKIVGTPSLREGKIERLNQWLAARGQTWASYGKTYFYSDSKNDLPLLLRVSNPVAVNPDEVLLQHAQQNGWAVLHFA
ncbi:MAG: HAD family hydrolase [Alysiella sp.]|uniref:HAD family hydrolase n=1 Tax=Alysiella sp. TaxID=1872483 RepID=UPI0026DC67B0|nr:HAD family hydrolase [Alysiella sp.]MDO4433077.1 HAD family hydrolase [Alysiella sp.]